MKLFKVQRGNDRQGVALVITLIMLSIITFMAVTFLVLSQRERESVTGATDQKIARNASDAALARVSSELLTRIMLKTNFQDFDLMVSTNYINNNGFIDGIPPDPRNVNYDHETNQISFTGGPVEMERNIANLLYNPRAPVFVETNAGTHQSEFRFYRDENRNGRFDKNGNWPVVVNDPNPPHNPVYISTNNAGQIITVATNAGGWVISNNFTGDPEWIGQLERPAELHSADNRFIARYAYLVVPVGKTLDMNYAHNRAKRPASSFTSEGFLRNQGVGTWEINLAGFLADLNTNAWWNPNLNNPGYFYSTNLLPTSSGLAFTNANDILNYRYGPTGYSNLVSARLLLSNNAVALNDFNVDYYSDGPITLYPSNTVSAIPDVVNNPWSGADNTGHFFATQDIFSQMPPGFQTVLGNLGTSNDSYNEYTFSRMVAQLGTDTAPDRGKININFKNTDDQGNVMPGMETNLMGWPAIDFFTNAAAAMFQQLDLRDFNGNLVTVTNIPIYEDITGVTNQNYYTPAVHRILQLAANIFDTTTNRFIGAGPTNYPTVFRPIFRSQGGVASIIGFQEVTDPTVPLTYPFLNAGDFVKTPQPINAAINIYGIPWVIGAKKGFPNFNLFSMENAMTISRDLQFTNQTAKPPWKTNDLFGFAITNSFAIEGWNSYTNGYGRALTLIVSNELSITLSNQVQVLISVSNVPFGTNMNLSSGWSGWSAAEATIANPFADRSFIVPVNASTVFTNAAYTKQAPFIQSLQPILPWSAINQPQLWMMLENKMRYVLLDTSVTPNRVIDFVSIDRVEPPVDINAKLFTGQFRAYPDKTDLEAQWNTNLLQGGFPIGILNQILAGLDDKSGVWRQVQPNAAIRTAQASLFNQRLLNGGTNNFQAPYSPSETVYQRISWQANDPLVHYMVPDITSTNGSKLTVYNSVETVGENPQLASVGRVNFAYQPWGGRHIPYGSDQDPNAFGPEFSVKDPGLQQSDSWDFPTNKFASIGMLGRVHRGTPWQTIDMKPSTVSTADWVKWNNDNVFLTNRDGTYMIDAQKTHPTADYGLFDLFTTAVNENASYGRLSVNQTNLAAWSAVLSGVAVLTNSVNGAVGPDLISPAGVYDAISVTNVTNSAHAVAVIVNGINATRASTNSPNGTVPNGFFQHAGDVLATPQLSVASPFLNTNGIAGTSGLHSPGAGGINDEIMERIPQQIMSLLTLNQTPRFVIYSYGQTLHPADHSLVSGGAFNGLCTNYQITAESATRAVVRVEGTADPHYVNGNLDPLGRSYPPHIVVEQFNVLGPD